MPNLNSDLDDALEPIVRILSDTLRTTIENHLVSAYISGDRELMTWGMTKSGIPIAYEGPPMEKAISWAQKHGAQLVTKMDEETKNRLAQVVGEAIKEKKGIPGLARDIRGEFDNMTRYRSKMIARTETADALEQAFMDRSKSMGVDGKEWITFDPCPICEANEGEGKVPIDHTFNSGHTRPPAHPNCRCALAPVMLK